jgi:O-antigen ligase
MSSLLSVSVAILLLFPAWGSFGLLWVIVTSLAQHFSQIINQKINWGWGILAIWLAINSYLAHQPQEAWLGIANFVPFLALFMALSPLLNSVTQLRRLAWSLVLPALPIVVLGLGQLWLRWGSLPIVKTVLGWELIPQGVPLGRMSSVFMYANLLAIYLAIAFILSLGLWLDYWQQKKPLTWQLVLLTTIIFADSIGLALTSSRNAWGIAFIGLIAFALYLGWRWLVYGVIGLGISIGWAAFAPQIGQEWIRKIIPEFIWGRLSDQMYPDRPVATLRITQWQFCWSKIQEKPIVGWGLRNFTPLYQQESGFWFGHPHSLFLMLGMEIGIIAIIWLSLIVGKIMANGLFYLSLQKNQRDRLLIFTYILAFSSYILFNLFDVTIFDLRINTIGWTLLAGINGISKEKS